MENLLKMSEQEVVAPAGTLPECGVWLHMEFSAGREQHVALLQAERIQFIFSTGLMISHSNNLVIITFESGTNVACSCSPSSCTSTHWSIKGLKHVDHGSLSSCWTCSERADQVSVSMALLHANAAHALLANTQTVHSRH